MRNKRYEMIKCPHCGAEYHPAEIYLPHVFFGNPSCIDKDVSHKVLDFCGNDMELQENYICDYCNTSFRVTAKVQFYTKQDVDFNSTYRTSLHKESLFLSED